MSIFSYTLSAFSLFARSGPLKLVAAAAAACFGENPSIPLLSRTSRPSFTAPLHLHINVLSAFSEFGAFRAFRATGNPPARPSPRHRIFNYNSDGQHEHPRQTARHGRRRQWAQPGSVPAPLRHPASRRAPSRQRWRRWRR
jgi:hypothetical protein